jgi:uncharacterized membrane protein
MIDPFVNALFACALAVLFASAALHKVAAAPRFQAQLDAYRLLPAGLVRPAAWLLAGIEALIALALLWPDPRPYAAVAAAVLLAAYAGAMAINLQRGRTHIDCGCGDAPVRLSAWLLARNGLLILSAATLMLSTTERSLTWADLAMAVVVLPALLLLYRALEQLLENASALREWRMSRD